jgi:hypothetical protein
LVAAEIWIMSDLLSGNIRINDSVICQELGDNVVLLNMANDEFYGLNSVGSAMWKCLVQEGNVLAAGDLLINTYDANGTVIRGDLEALARKLVSEGLLEIENTTAPDPSAL